MYGETAAARKRVGELREQGGDIRAIADRLVARAESVPWHGRAADAMRARIKERAAHLRAAAGRHDTAADSLSRHVTEVDALKDAIEAREHKATSMIEDARTRATQHAHSDDATPADDHEEALLAFTPPPSGHRDWLTAELSGL